MSKVTLGQVATEVRESTKDPARLPIVGLEHLIPGEIRLTQWSETSENTFTKLFHKGQVLFGRRRAYQKKAAVADFDGVCSGDITVIAAKPERLLPDLLPFIVNDDRFFDFAMEKSAGSLSPRVKWAQLAEYTFDLPDDIGEQRRHAKLLWAIERNRSAYQNLLTQMDELVKSQFVEMFGDASRSENKYPIMPLSKVCDIIQDGEHATVKRTDAGNLFISSRNIKTDHSIVLDAVTYVSDSDFERIRKRFAPEQGDIILTCAGTIGNSAIVPQMQPFVADRGLTMIRPNYEVVGSIYLHACFLSNYVQQQMQVGIHATALAHLYLNKINALQVIVPPLQVQKRFESLVIQTDKSKYDSNLDTANKWTGGDMCA